MLNNLSIDSIACKEEAHPSDNCPQDVLQQYQFFLTAYFRLSSTATATETVIPTMGEQCNALRIEIPATCRWQVATLPMEVKTFRICYFRDSSTATATDTVIPTMGLLPAPRKPIISTWAGTEEEPANWASLCIRPMVSVMP